MNGNLEMNSPLVSIIMPCFNSQAHIACAIQSVLHQTYSIWELLIIDNGSTDQTLAIAESFLDARIRRHQYDDLRGAAHARNCGISLASGDYIAFLDSDDFWDSKKLEIQIHEMRKNHYSFTYTDYVLVNQAQNVIALFQPQSTAKYKDILRSNYIGCSTVLIDCVQLGKVFMPIDTDIREDMACWLGILRDAGPAYKIQDAITYYRVHEESSSFHKRKMIRNQYRTYRVTLHFGRIKSIYYMILWMFLGMRKYRNIKNQKSISRQEIQC